MKNKEVSEKLILRNQRAPNPEGSKIFQISEGSESGGVLYLLTQRGPNPEGSYIC